MKRDTPGGTFGDVPGSSSVDWHQCLSHVKEICRELKITHKMLISKVPENGFAISTEHLLKIIKLQRPPPRRWHSLIHAFASTFSALDVNSGPEHSKQYYLSRIYGVDYNGMPFESLTFRQYAERTELDFYKITAITTSIDNQTIPFITAEAAGTIEQWVSIQELLKECGSFIIADADVVAGYFFLMPLVEETYENIRNGSLDNALLRTADVPAEFGMRGVYRAFLIDLAIIPQYRSVKSFSMLSNSIYKMLVRFADLGIFFDRICAHAYTLEGERICRRLKMTRTGSQHNYNRQTEDGSYEPVPVYEMKLLPYSDSTEIFRRFIPLREKYRKFSE